MARIHLMTGVGDKLDMPAIAKISFSDLGDALRKGAEDFWAKPSHYLLLALIYPVIGMVLTVWMNGYHTWPMLYPLIGGFALLGPVAAIPLYEISKQREEGREPSWRDALGVLRSPAIGSIIIVGVLLFVLFTLWLTAAQAIYESIFGSVAPRSLDGLIMQVFGSEQGTMLLAVGTGVGALFALVVLCTSVVALPLLIDRDVGAYVAIETSFRAVLHNRVVLMAWGLIVGAAVFLGSAMLFVGLAVVLPILGHATWHLYRKLVPKTSFIR
jgi:uncharacterized membrane protein